MNNLLLNILKQKKKIYQFYEMIMKEINILKQSSQQNKINKMKVKISDFYSNMKIFDQNIILNHIQ